MRRFAMTILLGACFVAVVFGSATTAPSDAASRAPATVYATTGPGLVISLKTASGQPIRRLVAGRQYRLVVRDRSSMHNFHLVGPGTNRATTVGYMGTTTWTLKFRPGTYRYRCDPHAPAMNGSFTVVSA